MTPSDPDLARTHNGRLGDLDRSALDDVTPIALVARIAESLPQLDEGELDELADAVESLTEAIGLRIDWLYTPVERESPASPEE